MANYQIAGIRWAWGVVAFAALGMAPRAYSQGFMVKPMMAEVTVMPGRASVFNIEVRNTLPNESLRVECEEVALTQSMNGAWAQGKAEGDAATQPARSAAAWTEAKLSTAAIAPLEAGTVAVRVEPPRASRGTYYVGLVLRRPAPGGDGIKLVLQFLVPILINVQGPTPREAVAVSKVDLGFLRREGASVCYGRYDVANTGETIVRVGADLTVLWKSARGYQRILTRTYDEKPVLPGSTVIFARDLERALPPGSYRVQVGLRVGGRVRQRLERDIDFAGDPDVKDVVPEVALQLDPERLELQAGRGSRRSAVVTVRNPSDYAVTASCAVAAPPGLEGVVLGKVDGKEFTCAPWVTCEPSSFTIGPGGSKNLRVTASVPADTTQRPLTFANLIVESKDAAGRTTSKSSTQVVLANPGQKPTALAVAAELAISLEAEDRYAVRANFENHGETVLVPNVSLQLMAGNLDVLSNRPMECAARTVLPLGRVTATGDLDLSRVDAGGYIVRAVWEAGGAKVASQLPIKVEVIDNRRVVTVVEQTEAAPAAAAGGDAPKAPEEK
ncbi:MAG: hypothetical protein IT204_23835 [Fimbriimonadaceae bacterium]|nr:hypothetical protein [Fimbriimonadaceae bacterium]